MRVCSVSGCPRIYDSNEGSRCSECRAQADKHRGTAKQRGYAGKGHRSFRTGVLMRDPICVACQLRQSTVADHYPLSKRELIDAGMDSNDPTHGRGLCETCHNKATAQHQPGGWNDRT